MTMLLSVRILVLALLIAPWAWAAARPRQAKSVLADFFLEKKGPLNLGLLRIWIFFLLSWRMAELDLAEIVSTPVIMRRPPPGWGWLTHHLPIFDPRVVFPVRFVGVVSGVCASIGLGTRFAAPIAALAATHVLGLPNFFGKVNHYGHAAVWFAFLLAASASNAALSLDAMIKTGRSGRLRCSLPALQSAKYNLPIRLGWLLLGVAYFFPGFYKAWESGDLWFNGEKIIQLTAQSALSDKNFSPIIELYEHPSLAVLAGIGTLVFEMGFIFLLFSKRLYWLSPVMGVLFHLGVKQTMRISFMGMLAVYTCFIDFEKLLLGLNPPPRLRENLGLPGGTTRGTSETDHTQSASAERDRGDIRSSGRSQGLGAVGVVGGLLIVANILFGITATSSWPISAFPLFSSRVPEARGKVSIKYELMLSSQGRETRVRGDHFPESVRGGRFNKLLRRTARAKADSQQQLMRGLMEMLPDAGIPVQKGDSLNLYRTKRRISGRGERELESRELLAQYAL